ncbi:MAG: hypothetical protein K9H13_06120 [Bacteroidales bacterium]|nr:hypothetical protein [Bacteroidales bacterium]
MKKTASLILFFLPFSIFSQEEYRVFFYSGDIEFKVNGYNQWQKVNRLNIPLFPADSINLINGSQMYLINQNGEQALVLQSGKLLLSDFLDEAGDGTDNIIASYAEFVWEEFNHPHKDLEKYADKYMKEQGGVSRAINIPEIYTPFYGSHIIADQIYFSWKDEGMLKYTLSFWDSDKNGRKLFELTLKDTSLSVSTKTAWIPADETFYWSVSLEGENPANFFPVKVLDRNDTEKIEAGLRQMDKQFDDYRPELIWLLIASFYEEDDLYQQARFAYLNALDFAANDAEIQEYFDLFLARMGRKM